MSDALVIAAHGTRDEAGSAEFVELVRLWKRLRPDRVQEAGFLEFNRPTIGRAIDSVVGRGAARVAVVPAMLAAAGHVKNDVPSEVADARRRHPGVVFQMARALEVHPGLLELCAVRFREAIAGKPEIPMDSTALLVVGRGTSDPDANATISRLSRFLWEASGVAFATVAFSGLTSPTVDQALEWLRRMGFARIVVQPYLLFDGVLRKRVVEAAERHSAADTSREILATAHLGVHDLLVQALEDRAHEAFHGLPFMNCDLCKYRVKLSGREADFGAPQEGHHLEVAPWTSPPTIGRGTIIGDGRGGTRRFRPLRSNPRRSPKNRIPGTNGC